MKGTVKAFADLRDIIGNDVQIDVIQGETTGGSLQLPCRVGDAVFESSGALRMCVSVLKEKRQEY
jgi:hypothetical protein